MSHDKSSYKCADCVEAVQFLRDENTPTCSLRLASALELRKKVLYPDRDLILCSLKDPESLSVQIKTMQLNRVNTTNLVEN
jgi:hypothetical protein